MLLKPFFFLGILGGVLAFSPLLATPNNPDGDYQTPSGVICSRERKATEDASAANIRVTNALERASPNGLKAQELMRQAQLTFEIYQEASKKLLACLRAHKHPHP